MAKSKNSQHRQLNGVIVSLPCSFKVRATLRAFVSSGGPVLAMGHVAVVFYYLGVLRPRNWPADRKRGAGNQFAQNSSSRLRLKEIPRILELLSWEWLP